MKKNFKYQSAKFDNAFKNVGKKTEPLTDEEWKRVEKLLKTAKDFSKPIKFDDNSDILIMKVPDSFPPKELDKTDKDGNTLWKVSVIAHDGQWWSFLTNKDEAEDFEASAGNTVAIVGKQKIKGDYNNITKVRGSTLLSVEKDEQEPEDDLI